MRPLPHFLSPWTPQATPGRDPRKATQPNISMSTVKLGFCRSCIMSRYLSTCNAVLLMARSIIDHGKISELISRERNYIAYLHDNPLINTSVILIFNH